MCRRSGRVRCGDVYAARWYFHPRGHRREAARRVRSGDTPKARRDGYAQLGAGEQGVQRRGVERGRRSVVGSEDQGTLCKIGKKNSIPEPLYWAAEFGNVPAVRACLESGEDVNKVLTGDNSTALHVAASMATRRW